MANIWTRRGHTAYLAWLGEMPLRSTTRFGTSTYFCERAGLRPISEAPNIHLDIFTRDGGCRPADILCIPALALAQVLPNGARAIRTEPICLDITVISALGQDHWRHKAVRPGSAADIYSAAKATRNDIKQQVLGGEVPLLADCA